MGVVGIRRRVQQRVLGRQHVPHPIIGVHSKLECQAMIERHLYDKAQDFYYISFLLKAHARSGSIFVGVSLLVTSVLIDQSSPKSSLSSIPMISAR